MLPYGRCGVMCGTVHPCVLKSKASYTRVFKRPRAKPKLSHRCVPPVCVSLASEIEWDRIQVSSIWGRFAAYLLFRLVLISSRLINGTLW